MNVFQALTNSVRSGALLGTLKAVVPAVALAFGAMTMAPAAHAATYVFDDGEMYSYRTLRLSGSGFTTVTVKAAPVLFDGYIKGTPNEPFENLVAFCVDVYHSISMKDYQPDLTYTDDIELEHNSHWDPNKRDYLSDDEIVQIGKLVNYGTEVWYNHNISTTTKTNELASVQGAIWKVVSGLTVTATGNTTTINNTLTSRIAALSNANTYTSAFTYAEGPVYSSIKLLTPFKDGKYPKQYPHKDLTQSFAIGEAVPEPGTWVMMIGGFGLAGAMLRRRRQQFVAVKINS
jgi:PEP-CTERM motif